MAGVGEVEHHRQTQELVPPLPHHGTTTGNDDFREMVVQGHAVVADGHRSLAVDDKGGCSITTCHKVS